MKPVLAYTKAEACTALGISHDTFERHVQPRIKLVRLGRLRLYPATELQRFLNEHAAVTLAEEAAR